MSLTYARFGLGGTGRPGCKVAIRSFRAAGPFGHPRSTIFQECAHLNLITRNDTSLAIGLIVGATVAFQQPLHFLLDAARDVEERYRLDLVPALTIVTGVYIFHQYRKRVLSKAEAAAASAEAAQARARSEELERLMTFSQDLARVLDVAMLQQVLWKNLPSFTRTRGRPPKEVAILQKPFSSNALAAKVREALDAPRTAVA